MLELILSAIQAIMQVMVVILAGVIFANNGYIDNDKQKWLSKLNLTFFTPCLLFSNIAPLISLDSLLIYWPIPVFYIIFTLISWLLCQIVLPIFGIEKYYKRFILACVMFSNVNSLPIAIVASLAVSEAGKSLFWKPDDDPSIVCARGISYTLFFGLFCNLLRWSLGYNLLQKKEDDELLNDSNDIKQYGTVNPIRRYTSSCTTDSNATASSENQNTSILASIHQYMSPPLYAALLALVVGLIPPIKTLFYHHDAFLYGSVSRAIENCGKASVPLVLFCLGAQLKIIRETQTEASTGAKVPVLLTIFLRMIITPVLVIPIIYFFYRFGSDWSELATDPMFIVSMVIVNTTPTSINLAQITQVNGIFEKEMLSVLFWSYGVICIPICTLIVFIALYIVS